MSTEEKIKEQEKERILKILDCIHPYSYTSLGHFDNPILALKTLITYEWNLNLDVDDIDRILIILDRNIELFDITNKLYRMLKTIHDRVCYVHNRDKKIWIHNIDLYRLCVDVGFKHVSHTQNYYSIKFGKQVIIGMFNDQLLKINYIKKVMITF
jgi:hypothetical protein